MAPSARDRKLFENLFVLEMANNHWGNIARGKRLVRDFGAVVRQNNVKAAIKLQIRNVDLFIHKDYKGNQDIRYIKKTEATRLSKQDFQELVNEIKSASCMPMATPFDEHSVDLCVEFGFPIIKIASSDVNDWPLLEKIASTKLPVIASSGGASEKQLDDLVAFFENRNIPLALNHCVSLYPSEDHQLELNQIDYLQGRYPNHVIGFSTHEYHSWEASMYLSYAKGVRTWERHVDIEMDEIPVSSYCSKPDEIDLWFKAFNKAKEMCGSSSNSRRVIPKEEIEYLDALVRGIYAKCDIPAGTVITNQNFSTYFYMAVPLLKGQISVREIINGTEIIRAIKVDQPVHISDIESPYNHDQRLKDQILNRGLRS
jgi:N-acetylneuraminate synthase